LRIEVEIGNEEANLRKTKRESDCTSSSTHSDSPDDLQRAMWALQKALRPTRRRPALSLLSLSSPLSSSPFSSLSTLSRHGGASNSTSTPSVVRRTHGRNGNLLTGLAAEAKLSIGRLDRAGRPSEPPSFRSVFRRCSRISLTANGRAFSTSTPHQEMEKTVSPSTFSSFSLFSHLIDPLRLIQHH
jgi:hypothetical protein